MIVALAGAAILGALAAAPPTIEATPSVVTVGAQVNLLGAAPGASPGDRVVVQMKRCGDSSWSVTTSVETETLGGGRWAAAVLPTLNGLFRVRFGGQVSAARRVQVRPYVKLDTLTPPILRVEVGIGRYLPGKRVYLQRFVDGAWKRVAATRLERDHASFYAISSGRFRYRAPAGAKLRAFVPAGSCYLSGISRVEERD